MGRVAAKENEETWQFFFSDIGIGFDPKDRDGIFALYKKLHGPSVYQGSTFSFTIPKVKAQAQKPGT
jgi:light-regulated signal transduction histidine kinase (bacteriophytochrome)